MQTPRRCAVSIAVHLAFVFANLFKEFSRQTTAFEIRQSFTGRPAGWRLARQFFEILSIIKYEPCNAGETVGMTRECTKRYFTTWPICSGETWNLPSSHKYETMFPNVFESGRTTYEFSTHCGSPQLMSTKTTRQSSPIQQLDLKATCFRMGTSKSSSEKRQFTPQKAATPKIKGPLPRLWFDSQKRHLQGRLTLFCAAANVFPYCASNKLVRFVISFTCAFSCARFKSFVGPGERANTATHLRILMKKWRQKTPLIQFQCTWNSWWWQVQRLWTRWTKIHCHTSLALQTCRHRKMNLEQRWHSAF